MQKAGSSKDKTKTGEVPITLTAVPITLTAPKKRWKRVYDSRGCPQLVEDKGREG
jgi:hypothetical protein